MNKHGAGSISDQIQGASLMREFNARIQGAYPGQNHPAQPSGVQPKKRPSLMTGPFDSQSALSKGV